MALVNLSILAFGTLLVAVPIALHLIMRQQPKYLVFPALQFVQRRRETNRRRLRVRRWILLLLRCAAIVVLAGALARPSVAATVFGLWLAMAAVTGVVVLAAVLTIYAWTRRRGRLLVGGLGTATLAALIGLIVLLPRVWRESSAGVLGDQQAPVAAVLVFDTSPRMLYIHQNQTRLDLARENGRWLLRQLPEDSEVAVLDSRLGPAAFAIDRGAAAREVDGLQVTNVPMPLVRVLESAVLLARQSNLPRREIYVFTDLTAATWDPAIAGQRPAELEPTEDAILYLWDVGVASPGNFWLGSPRLVSETLARNGLLQLRVELMRLGPGGERTVQLQLEEPNEQLPIIVDGQPVLPQAQTRRRQPVEVGENGSQWIDFSVPGLAVGTHHGQVKIVGQDGLSCDDVRYFTVEVALPWRILVATGKGARSTFVTDALAPEEFRETGRASFRCDTIKLRDLASTNLANYAAVCLLDPGPQPDTIWQTLSSFVHQGGGLGIFLGRNAKRDPFRTPVALEVLPGTLSRVWRAPDEGLQLAPRTFDHAILAWTGQDSAGIPWDLSPIFHHWGFDPLASDSVVVVRFGNDQPAIVERRLGEGRVLAMTTPMSDPLHVPGRPAWNELLTGPGSWPSFVLCNQMFRYLVGSGERKRNYLVGQTAHLPLSIQRERERLQLFTPRGDWRELTVKEGGVTYPFTETPGTYRLKGEPATRVATGFSANLPIEASHLDRVQPEQLDAILGPNRYRLARNRDEIDRGVGEARVGREFYPYLIMLLTVVLGVEYLLANRFYRQPSTTADSVSLTRPWMAAEGRRTEEGRSKYAPV